MKGSAIAVNPINHEYFHLLPQIGAEPGNDAGTSNQLMSLWKQTPNCELHIGISFRNIIYVSKDFQSFPYI